MTVKEAARRLELPESTVYAMCSATPPRLGHYRVGVNRGRIRIGEADLAAYLAGVRVEAGAPAAPAPPASPRRPSAEPTPEDWVRRFEEFR